MSTFLVIEIVLSGLLAAVVVLHVYARWTIRNIGRQETIFAPVLVRPGSDSNTSGRDRGDSR